MMKQANSIAFFETIRHCCKADAYEGFQRIKGIHLFYVGGGFNIDTIIQT